jgi:hypothetical protein
MQGVLTSRHFIYLVEGDTVARERLTDTELASRLSYFLWSSMPDDGLLTAAKGGTLNGDGLKKEVDRMLADSKASRFIDDFARQWLQLHRVGMFPPDKKLYPAYDAWLEESMRTSRWSSSARCSARTCPSTLSSIPTGPWPMRGSAISTDWRSRRPTASSVSR